MFLFTADLTLGMLSSFGDAILVWRGTESQSSWFNFWFLQWWRLNPCIATSIFLSHQISRFHVTAHQPSIANSRFWILWNLMVELGLSLNVLR
jgi:hypothetical protein